MTEKIKCSDCGAVSLKLGSAEYSLLSLVCPNCGCTVYATKEAA